MPDPADELRVFEWDPRPHAPQQDHANQQIFRCQQPLAEFRPRRRSSAQKRRRIESRPESQVRGMLPPRCAEDRRPTPRGPLPAGKYGQHQQPHVRPARPVRRHEQDHARWQDCERQPPLPPRDGLRSRRSFRHDGRHAFPTAAAKRAQHAAGAKRCAIVTSASSDDRRPPRSIAGPRRPASAAREPAALPGRAPARGVPESLPSIH